MKAGQNLVICIALIAFLGLSACASNTLTSSAEEAPVTSAGDVSSCELVVADYELFDSSIPVLAGGQARTLTEVAESTPSNFEAAISRAQDSELVEILESAKDAVRNLADAGSRGTFAFAMDPVLERCETVHGISASTDG